MSSYMLKKNGQNRLVFATKIQNNDFIFLSGEVDSMKKNKIFKPIYNHTYIHKKKYIDMVIYLELNMPKNRKKISKLEEQNIL